MTTEMYMVILVNEGKPVAFMAATALVSDRTLVTRNVQDFDWIPGLRVLNPLAL